MSKPPLDSFRLSAQRIASRLPAPARRMLRSAAQLLPSTDSTALLEPWLVTVPASWQLPVAKGGGRPRIAGDRTVSGPRCVLVSSGLDAGGMDEVVGFLARTLPEHGFSVAVAHAPVRDDQPVGRLGHTLREAGVEVVDLRGEALRAWIREWDPDVASSHGAAESAHDAFVECGVPVVETLHGMHTLFNTDRAAAARRRLKLDRIIAVSETVRQQYLRIDVDCPPETVVTVPNGVDTGRLHIPDREAARALLGLGDEFVFLSLSRHSIQKNVFGLVAAFTETHAAQAGARLIVSGRVDDPEYLQQVARLRDRSPVADRIHLRDHFPSPGVLLAAADCFVLDSFFEGWALASMEALAAGVPTIMSDVGGAQEQAAAVPQGATLVANPLGDPLAVDWNSMSRARFLRQQNRSALVEAMDVAAGSRVAPDERAEIAALAATAFRPETCSRRHAELLLESIDVSQRRARAQEGARS